MNVLAIETSTKTVSVAFIDGSSQLIEHVLDHGHPSGSLLKLIDSTLKECKKTINDIELFVVDIGPGSFTGIRVGISTVLGLSYATTKPVVGVPSFEVFAYSVSYNLPVVVWIDTRQGDVYQAILSHRDKEYLTQPKIGKPDNLLREVEDRKQNTVAKKVESNQQTVNMKEKVVAGFSLRNKAKDREDMRDCFVFVGDGAIKFRELIKGRFGNYAIFPECSFFAPSAGILGMIGLRKFLKKGVSQTLMHPFYLRDFFVDKKLT